MHELAKEPKDHIAPYYGTIKSFDSKETQDFASQSKEVTERSLCQDILATECSKPQSVFAVDGRNQTEAENPPFVKLSATTFANDENPRWSSAFDVDVASQTERLFFFLIVLRIVQFTVVVLFTVA